MTLQSSLSPSDPLWLSEIAAEYGRSPPYMLTDFLGVPDIQTSVSSADPLWISEFLGKSNAQVTLSGDSYVEDTVTSGSAAAAFELGSDGHIYTRRFSSDSGMIDIGTWLNVPGLAGQFEVYASPSLSGGPSSGTFNTWLPLSSSQTWGLSRSGYGEATLDLALSFRRATSGASAGSATAHLICNISA